MVWENIQRANIIIKTSKITHPKTQHGPQEHAKYTYKTTKYKKHGENTKIQQTNDNKRTRGTQEQIKTSKIYNQDIVKQEQERKKKKIYKRKNTNTSKKHMKHKKHRQQKELN